MAIPYDGRLALVGDADAIDILRAQPLRNKQLGKHFELARKDVFGIMLHPTRTREYLREGALRDPRMAPLRSTSTARDEVVPWSSAIT